MLLLFHRSLWLSHCIKRKRQRKIKKMAGEVCADEIVQGSPEVVFRVEVFYCIIDRTTKNIESRFIKHKHLYLDMALFDPKIFGQYQMEFPVNVLKKVCELIPTVNQDRLKEELISFTSAWPKICQESLDEDYKELENVNEDEADEGFHVVEKEESVPCTYKIQCNSCIKCAFKVIVEFNMYSVQRVQYTELYKVYKYLLTVPMTQIRLVIEESLNQLPFTKCMITTPTGAHYDGLKYQRGNCGVSIVRSGEAMEQGLRDCCRSIRIGKILVESDPDTHEARIVYARFPEDIATRKVLLMYPIMSTGNTVIKAVAVLKEHNVLEENIILSNLFITPFAAKAITSAYPQMVILTSELHPVAPNHFGQKYFGTD